MKELSPYITIKYELDVVDREEPRKAHLIKVLSVSHCLWMTQQAFIYQTLTLFIFL